MPLLYDKTTQKIPLRASELDAASALKTYCLAKIRVHQTLKVDSNGAMGPAKAWSIVLCLGDPQGCARYAAQVLTTDSWADAGIQLEEQAGEERRRWTSGNIS